MGFEEEINQKRIEKLKKQIFFIEMQDYLSTSDYELLDVLNDELKELENEQRTMA